MVKQFATTSLRPQNRWTIRWVVSSLGRQIVRWFIHAGQTVWWTIRKWMKQPWIQITTAHERKERSGLSWTGKGIRGNTKNSRIIYNYYFPDLPGIPKHRAPVFLSSRRASTLSFPGVIRETVQANVPNIINLWRLTTTLKGTNFKIRESKLLFKKPPKIWSALMLPEEFSQRKKR